MSATSHRELSTLFEEADKAWDEYVATVKRELVAWERLRPALVERLSILRARISSSLEEAEELKVKLELGLIDEEKSQKKLNALLEEIPAMRSELEQAWLLLERNTLKSILHMKRLNLPLDVTEEDLRKKLESIETSFKRHIIDSKDVYEELKQLVEQQLQLVST